MGPWRRTTVSLVALTVAACPALTGCTEGVDGPILVLTLATPDPVTEPNGPQIQLFAQEVERRSSGTIRIEPVWDITLEGADDWDQTLAKAVADGTYDLGLVPSRAWDVLGVTSLRALNTPFLVTSDAAMRAVLAADLREDLLAGLPAAGVAGIDLWPSEMRRPFGFREPLLGLADFAGQKIRSPTSRTVTALLEAFGATVVQDTKSPRNQRGLESSFALAGSSTIATGNVVFFPKVESLVAYDGLRSRLRPDQWQVVLDAAAATRRDQLEAFPSDVEDARAYCAAGNRIVAATPSDLAALKSVGTKIRSELEQDPGTAELIDKIEAVVATVPPSEPITECPAAGSGAPEPDDTDQHALDGIYVAHVTRRDLVDAGVTDPDRISDNTGRFTWTLDGGLWTLHQKAHHYLSSTEGFGTYEFQDGVLTWSWDAEEVVTARLQLGTDGTIHFLEPHDSVPELQLETEGFFGQPWRRVGDLQD